MASANRDEGILLLWDLLSTREVAVSARLNRLRRAILKIRSRIAHCVDQRKITQETPQSLSRRMDVGNGEHMILKRDFWRALDEGKITSEEYDLANGLIGQSPSEFNARELAAKIAIVKMASGFSRERGLK